MTSVLWGLEKFLVKMRVVAPLRAALVRLFAPRANRAGWERRMFIVNLEGLGDLVMFTGVLKQYRLRFPEYRLTLLMKSGTGLEEFLCPAFVDHVLTVKYRRFAVDPFYGYLLIASLRRTGFEVVVNQDFSASEIQGKVIATSLGAERVIGSDGLGLEYKNPFDIQQAKNLRIVERKFLPLYTTVVSTRDMNAATPNRFPNMVAYYARIFEHAHGGNTSEYSPLLAIPRDADAIGKKFGLSGHKYVILNVSASVPYKRWPIDRFAEIAQILVSRGLLPVMIGVGRDRFLGDALAKRIPSSMNIAGRTSLHELVALVGKSYLVLTNDTSSVHLAVALRRPSLCITGGGQFGIQSNYGYSDINVWAYLRTDCYGDNFRCGRDLPPYEISPCMAAVSVDLVQRKLMALLDHLETAKREGKNCPCEPFRMEF